MIRNLDTNDKVFDTGWETTTESDIDNKELAYFDSENANVDDGDYSIRLRARDEAGNNRTKNITVTIDNTAPVVSVDKLKTTDRTPEITGTVDDPTATIFVTIGSQTYRAKNNTNGTWTLADNTTSEIKDGTYNVVAEAFDAAGNTSTDNTTDELSVDATAPKIAVNKINAGTNHSPILTGKINDPAASVRITVYGKTYKAVNHGNGTWSLRGVQFTPNDVHGNFEVSAIATDTFGNIGYDSTTYELTIENGLLSTPADGPFNYVSSIAGDSNELDTDGDGIPDSRDDTPNGEEKSESSEKDDVASNEDDSNFDGRWVLLTAAIIAFLWFLLRQRNDQEA